MAQLVDQAVLDDKEYLAALKRIDANVEKMTRNAERDFQRIQKSAKVSGVQIGAISGIVSSITAEFINLGQRAIGVLVDIGERSTETALQMDTLRARLLGIFDGSQEAADEAFDFIQQKSKELGINLGELAGAFLPKTESLEQFERVAKIATALARSDPEQGAIGARIALLEALSGTFISLQRRFEIPKEDIDRIKEAFDTQGIEGFITMLETVLAESGKSFDDLSDTAQASINRIGQQFTYLSGVLGTPVVKELQEQFDNLFQLMTEHGDDLELIADAFGRVLAHIVELISTGLADFLAGLDTEQVIEIAETFFDIVENARTLADVLSDTDVSPSFIDNVQLIVDKLNEALETAIKLSAIVKAEAERQAAEAEIRQQFAEQEAGGPITFGRARLFAGAVGGVGQEDINQQAAIAGQEAYNKSIEESLKLIEESTKRKEENREATDRMRQAQEDEADSSNDAANALLQQAAATRALAELTGQYEDAQAKVNEEMTKAQTDFTRKLEDIDIETERKRLDIQIEFAGKREDAARDHLQELEDIQRKYNQDVADAALDLERDEEDIARKFGDERIDLEREQRQEELDVETNYRQRLEDIQNQFLLDADEAERRRDAVAFLRAMRERDQAVQEAELDRQREIDETRTTGEQKQQELRIQQERELEEARLANERKLEDLRTNLERQIEEQNRAYARELEDIAISEQRKFEELQRSRERDIEDAQKAYDRKLEDLRLALEEELKLIEEFAAKKAALEEQINAGPRTFTSGGTKYTIPVSSGGVPAPVGAGGLGGPQGMFQAGGYVTANRPALVGEAGPELFIPQSAGAIIPNSQLALPTVGTPTAINNISNVRGGPQITIPDAAGLLGNPIAIAQIKNIVLQVLGEAG